MRKLCTAFIICCSFCLFLNSQTNSFTLLSNKFLTLSDDIELCHDLYLPKEGQHFSSILIRTPYGKEGIKTFATYFASQGFAVIVQDVRGKNKSKGFFIPFVNEKRDGLETLDWITKQSWCNGSIGLWGSSYLSYCGLVLSDSQHPSLKGIFNLSGWIDGEKINNPGGALHQMLIIPWLLSDGQTSKVAESGADLDEMFAHRPLREAIPGIETTFTVKKNTITPVNNPNEKFNYAKVHIPIMHMNGWYDFTTSSTIDAYKNLEEHKTNQHLILGPWYHNQIYDGYNYIGDYELPDQGQLSFSDFLSQATNWFQYTLNGKPLEDDLKVPVKYYVLFLDRWKHSKQWPPENSITPYFLNQGLGLSTSLNRISSKSKFTYNPEQPNPTLGGANFFMFADKLGIKDQEDIETRKDLLLFTTTPFKNDQIVAGDISVDLFVESEGIATDFTAKLTLVDKAEISKNIVDGIIRCDPGTLNNTVNKIRIDLGSIAFRIAQGEKLRLQISSSNYPKFNRNPNTGEDSLDAIEFKSVIQTIYYSEKYPSKINIPFLKK